MRAHKNKRSEKVCGNAENVRVNIRGEFAEGAELMGGGSGQALYKVLWRMLETSEEGLDSLRRVRAPIRNTVDGIVRTGIPQT